MFNTITSGLMSRMASQPRRHSSATLSSLKGSIAMIEFSEDGTIITANPLFLDSMGYALTEIVGQHHRIFCPPEEVSSAGYAAFWQRLRTGDSLSSKFLRLAKNGRPVIF